MVYIFVIVGSIIILSSVVGGRAFLAERAMKRFVRGISKRSERRRYASSHETAVQRPKRSARTTALDLKKVRELLLTAERAIVRGNLAEAEFALIQALSTDQRSEAVRSQLAKLYLSMNKNEKAEAMYAELCAGVAMSAHFANLGLARYRLGKYLEASDAYAQALKGDPANPERQFSYGHALFAAGRFAEAASALEKASRQLARNIELLHMLAECHERLGDMTRARETYKKINKLQPYDESVKVKMAALSAA